MNKRFLSAMLLALVGLTAASCSSRTTTSTPESSTSTTSETTSTSQVSSSSEVVLSAITFAGADDIELDFDTPFNALTGVTATGNNSVDYTSSIVLQSTSDAVNVSTGVVDTTQVGVHAIRYTVTVGAVTAQKWRYVTVNAPEVIEGEMLVNPDFALGTAGWDDPSVVYIADGAQMTLSVEDGALKAEVVAGANAWTPRFGQMNVPFEQGTTYEVSFEAKSSVTKIINLQVGELLSSAPYFTDFKPGLAVHKTITTEWASYSYKFTHNLDNKRGGVLFELGTVEAQAVNATVWFDNVAIVESTPDEDTTAPSFTGVSENRNVSVGAEYDPMAGVTAFDVVDGDVTSAIVVTIKDSEDNTVEFVNTSVAGTFTVTYTVEDEAGNVATATTTINVVSMMFKETNLIVNPSFDEAFDETTPEWTHWEQFWGAAPVVDYTLDTEAGTYSIAMVGGGDAAWAIQVVQEHLTVELGKTYRLSLDAFATVARPINIAVGYSFGDNQYEQYARQDAIMLGTESGTYDYVFTVTKPTHEVKFTIELGTQPGFADGTIVLEEVRLQEHDADPIIDNGDFALAGWRGFFNGWDGTTGSYGIVDGEFKIDITKYVAGAEWALQLIQDDMSMGGSSEAGVIDLTPLATYTIGFDVYATEAMNIHPYIISSNDWANLVTAPGQTVAITTTKTHYEVTAVAGAVVHGNEILKFQFGDMAAFDGVTKSVIFDNITVKDSTLNNISSVYNGDMETVLGEHGFFSPSPANTMKLGADGAVVTIAELGGAAYEPHYYYMIHGLEAGNYAIVLTLDSSVARDFRLNVVIPDWGYASILPDTKYDFSLTADEITTVTVTFTVASPITPDVKVELDFGTLGGTLVSLPTVVTLNSILVYRDYNAA